MTITNATNLRKKLYETLDKTIKYNDVVTVNTKNGNAVLLSEEDYNDLIATLELCAVPGMQKRIVDGVNTPLDECLSDDEVKW